MQSLTLLYKQVVYMQAVHLALLVNELDFKISNIKVRSLNSLTNILIKKKEEKNVEK